MAEYNPTFTQSYNGLFNKDAKFYSLNVGSNAYVTEREMNEIQWIRAQEVSNLVKNITDSGVLSDSNGLKDEFKVILSDEPNTITLTNFKSVINGFLLDNIAYNNEIGTIKIDLPNPPVAKTRRDIVILEAFFVELKNNDKPYMFGGRKNNKIEDYNIIDERIEKETCRRIQLQWRIGVYEDRTGNFKNGFVDDEGNYNPDMHPLFGTEIANYKSVYHVSDDDEHLYIADNISGTVDHKCYAIPLVAVLRLNNSGYSAEHNPTGGIDFDSENTVPDRPDNKFSNIIYEDQIEYIYNLASLGRKQYNKIYCTLENYFLREEILRNKLNSLTYQFENIENTLRRIGQTLPGIYDTQLYGYPMFRQMGTTIGAATFDVDRNVAYRKRFYSVGRELKNEEYCVVPSIVTADYDAFGMIGDMYIEKLSDRFYIYNTGARGLKLDISAFKVDNKTVYSGTGTFSGLDGTSITLPMELDDSRYFVHIMPIENMNACVGEIYVKFIDNEMIVYNTGYNPEIARETATSAFQWVLIDTFSDQLVNFEMDSVRLNGQDGCTVRNDNFGDNYHFLLGTPVVSTKEAVPEGSIGEFYTDTETINQITIYNTGEPGIYIQYMVFNEVPYTEYYDTDDVYNDIYRKYVSNDYKDIPKIVTK